MTDKGLSHTFELPAQFSKNGDTAWQNVINNWLQNLFSCLDESAIYQWFCHNHSKTFLITSSSRNRRAEVFCEKDVLKNFAKFTGKQLCQSLFFNNFIEITVQHGYSPVNLLYIFRALFPKKTYGGLLLGICIFSCFDETWVFLLKQLQN